MAEYLHPVSILRKHFRYEPDTGEMFWRDMTFIEWARGHGRAKQGFYQKWRREKAGKRVRFFFADHKAVARLNFRTVSYTGPRLAWALHYGVHPEDDEVIVTLNGDHKDLSIRNLGRQSDRDHYKQKIEKLRELRASPYRQPHPSWMPPEKMRLWFDYDAQTGEVYWQHLSWQQWQRLNRGRQSTAEAYEEYAYKLPDTPVEFTRDRRGDQVIKFKGKSYERKLLSYALKKGEHIPDICYLYHRNGDETDFRWENIGMTYRDDVDPDAD